MSEKKTPKWVIDFDGDSVFRRRGKVGWVAEEIVDIINDYEDKLNAQAAEIVGLKAEAANPLVTVYSDTGVAALVAQRDELLEAAKRLTAKVGSDCNKYDIIETIEVEISALQAAIEKVEKP